MLAAAALRGSDVVLIIVIVALIALSGVLALAETGLVRTSRHRAMALKEENRRGAAVLLRLVENPQRFLNTVLLLVLICQLVSATLVGVVAEHLFGGLGIAVATVFEIFVIFIFAEAVPKNWAVHRSDRAALLSAPLVSAVVAFPPMKWLSALLIKISNALVTSDGRGMHSYVTEEELLAMADVAMQEEVIEHQEHELIHSIFEFGDSVVREVMTPRPDMLAVECLSKVRDVIKVMMAAGYSRAPVYDGAIDDVSGIIYMKDLVLAEWDGKSEIPVRDVARPANFVPEAKKIAELLREMQAKKFHMAIVVDEYGGTAGLVTLEDLIEEIFGEIEDEYDMSSTIFEELEDGSYRVDARMPIDELNENLVAELPTGDWDTVGGLVYSRLGHIPTEGEDVVIGDYTVTAEKIKGQRIGRVRIRAINGAAGGGTSGNGRSGSGVTQEPAEPI